MKITLQNNYGGPLRRALLAFVLAAAAAFSASPATAAGTWSITSVQQVPNAEER
ncbi:MAG: hypothetical protein LBK99_06950 [Opitutaceae bacterium]|jgi:hypothetical protein|nr:hypothetical protein [Opitutaceae bacterium]